MIQKLEKKLQEIFISKIKKYKMNNQKVPDYSYTDFYKTMESLAVIVTNTILAIPGCDKEEIIHDVLYSITMRVYKGDFPEIFSWGKYLRTALFRTYVKQVASRQMLVLTNPFEIINYLDQPKYIYLKEQSTLYKTINKEYYISYIMNIVKKVKEITQNSPHIALLGFYCYCYNIEPKNIIPDPVLINKIAVIRDIFDYYLQTKRPNDMSILI